MPSPVGHALGGLAAGFLVAGVPARGRRLDRPGTLRAALLFAGVAVAPDLDLLVGAHSGPTHGLSAALLVGLAALFTHQRWRPLFRDASPLSRLSGLRVALAIAAAYASHTLLDWLGNDTSAPIGIMALWPFTREYYESSLHVFMAVSRRFGRPGFWRHNTIALARELAILTPVVLLVLMSRRRNDVA